VRAKARGCCTLWSSLNWTSWRRWTAGLTLAVSALVCTLAVTTYQACSIYNSTLLVADGGSEGDAGFVCHHAVWPPKPAHDDEGGLGPGLKVIAALQSIDIGVGGASGDGGGPLPPYGFDLDGVCTCPGPPSCLQPPGARESCDDDAGRDHIGIQLFRQLGSVAATGNVQINLGLKAGQYGLLISVDNYNGTANDTSVSVSVYVSNGVSGVQDGGMPQPQHDGTDRWTIDPGSLISPPPDGFNCDNPNSACSARYTDPYAYVANYVMVAVLDFPLSFGVRSFLGGAVMDLKSAYLVGTLTPYFFSSGGQSYQLTNGTIAGRWPTQRLLSNLATIPVPDGGFLCGNSAYDLLKGYVCQVADITSSPRSDIMGAPCDAVSMALPFSADPARLGEVYTVPRAPSGCQGVGGVLFADQCP
jgi:hypothetical protein